MLIFLFVLELLYVFKEYASIRLTDDIANFNRRLVRKNYKVTIVIYILFAANSWFPPLISVRYSGI